MSTPAVPAALALRCRGCGTVTDDPMVFRCPGTREGDDVDHVLVVPEPDAAPGGTDRPRRWPAGPVDGAVNPFVRYRHLLHAHRLHRAWGGTDEAFVELVGRLDAAVATVAGTGFRVTPLVGAELGAPGPTWVKDETGGVSGSHKGRHLMGLALHLAVVALAGGGEQPGASPRGALPPGGDRPLAIASCGNAALAAAVLARAVHRPLRVFVPPAAPPPVLARLDELGAIVEPCPRRSGERGDPCVSRFRAAVADGAVPFAVQGSENGLTLEGGATLGYELADQLPGPAHHLYVQVGGGALAASAMVGLRRARRAGRVERVPALHGVQSDAVAPLARAHDRVRQLMAGGLPARQALAHVVRHRSEAMWPWEREPAGIAGGILDDETYDWAAVVTELVDSGGRSIVVGEDALREANAVGRTATGIDADHTGTAGLAGLRVDAAAGHLSATDTAVVIFSGRRR